MQDGSHDLSSAVRPRAIDLSRHITESVPIPGVFSVKIIGVSKPGVIKKINVVDIDGRVGGGGQSIDLSVHSVDIEYGRRQALKLVPLRLFRQWPQIVKETIVGKAHDVLHINIDYIGYGAGGDQGDHTITVVRLNAHAFHFYVRIGRLEDGRTFSHGLFGGIHSRQIHIFNDMLSSAGDC